MDNSCHCEALPNRGPRGILCTRGEKAHTSKRVSVIACDNVISKVQCAPRGYYLSTSSGLKKPSRQLSMKYFTSGRSTSIAFSVVFSAIANSPFPDKVSSTHLIYAEILSAAFMSLPSSLEISTLKYFSYSYLKKSGSIDKSFSSAVFSRSLYADLSAGLLYFTGVGISTVMTSELS